MNTEPWMPSPAAARRKLMPDWFVAAWRIWKLGRQTARARKQAARVLVEAGEAILHGSLNQLEKRQHPRIVVASEKYRRIQVLQDAISESLPNDRKDYGTVSSWARPLVIFRGLAGRTVLRNQIAKGKRELRESCQMLATYAFDNDPALCKLAPSALAARVNATGAEIQVLAQERERILAPFGGSLLPVTCHSLAREIHLLALAILREFKGRFLPRLPAIAGLVVGWWIPRTFTDARAPGILRILGLASQNKYYVETRTLGVMTFWLPLMASAACAYLSDRLRALVQRRYALDSSLPNNMQREHQIAKTEQLIPAPRNPNHRPASRPMNERDHDRRGG